MYSCRDSLIVLNKQHNGASGVLFSVCYGFMPA